MNINDIKEWNTLMSEIEDIARQVTYLQELNDNELGSEKDIYEQLINVVENMKRVE